MPRVFLILCHRVLKTAKPIPKSACAYISTYLGLRRALICSKVRVLITRHPGHGALAARGLRIT